MFALVRTSLRFFVLGFVAGTLFAPRSGAETRRMLGDKLTVMANQLLELAALPPIESRPAAHDGGQSRARRAGNRGTNVPTSS
jgi:hypothetical protein